MRRSQHGWKVNDLIMLYTGYGFTIKQGSNHVIVKHPNFPYFRETITRSSSELSPAYIRDAISNIESLGLGETEDSNG